MVLDRNQTSCSPVYLPVQVQIVPVVSMNGTRAPSRSSVVFDSVLSSCYGAPYTGVQIRYKLKTVAEADDQFQIP